MTRTSLRDRSGYCFIVLLGLACGSDPTPVIEFTIGIPMEARPGETVLLDATVSPAPDTVFWAQTSGVPVTLTTNDEDAIFVAPDVSDSAQLTFDVTVTLAGESRTLSTSVFVVGSSVGKSSPVVEAGPPQNVNAGEIVQLVGNVTDADDDLVTQEWTQLSGPLIALSSDSALDATFLAPNLASDIEVVLELLAVDALGNRASDTLTIAISATNVAPTVDAGADQVVNEGDVVVLTGIVNDADGNLASTTWEQIAGPTVVISDPASLIPGFTAPAINFDTDLAFRLYALDDLGASGESLVTVSVIASRVPPVANAGLDFSGVSGEIISLVGIGTDSDGMVVSQNWSQVFGPTVVLSDQTTSTASFTAPAIISSTGLIFEYRVSDEDGLSHVDYVFVTVHPPAGVNSLPIADAGADFSVGSSALVNLNGIATDSDGSVVGVQWTQISGPTVTLLDDTTLTPSFTAPTVSCVDRLLFELLVTDNEGGTGTDRISVSVTGTDQAIVDQPYFSNLEIDDGGLRADALWQHGPPSSGPFGADTGVNVWGTNLAGNAPNSSDSSLCMPGIRLGGAERATLSFRLRSIVQNGDGLSVQMLHPELGWISLDSVPSPSSTAVGLATYGNLGLNADYVPIFVPLPEGIADPVYLRFRFVSDSSFASTGVYIDTIAVGLESEDPDSDGLAGIYDEYVTYGTDPYLSDTDGDGDNDGDEIQAGTDPLVPTDNSGVAPILVGDLLDFDNDGDGLLGEGGWQHGAPGTGPSAAYSGGQVWGVNLSGNYANNARAYLYLPPIESGVVTDALLTFRLWSSASNNDGVVVEVRGQDGTWNSRGPVLTPFDGTSLSSPAWSNQGYRDEYVLAAVDLSDFAGSRALVRFAFRSDGSFSGIGPYIDDILVVSASSDPDSDGIVGIVEEANLGSDPLVADTDGDGSNDGDELSAETDFLNPADYPGATVWTVPTNIDFESESGGFVSQRGIWQFGTPATSPSGGHTGGSVWGIRLSGNYASNERAYLYLPSIDLTGATEPTLYFRLEAQCQSGDGATIERYANGSWASLVPAYPTYDGNDALGYAAWVNQQPYVLAAVSLASFVGQKVRLRFSFRSNSSFSSPGVFIDDVRVDEEATDTDSDGLDGIISEFGTYGTDPELFDTDGDGVGDGDEVTAFTDPLDPLDF